MSLYKAAILEATGCPEQYVSEIEDIMRHDIFHSTLDWVPKRRFASAARMAWKVIQAEQKKLRKCKACGAREQVNAAGYTTIAPHLGYCIDCLNKAMEVSK